MAKCAECGGDTDLGCAELFDHLLALDHSHIEPWGSLHGVAVACYRLQHPGALAEGDVRTLQQMLGTYLEGGLPALQRWTGSARRLNSHRHAARPAGAERGLRGRDTGAGHAATRADFEVTLADVAVDGTFPATGYPERVRDWARATLQARGQTGAIRV